MAYPPYKNKPSVSVEGFSVGNSARLKVDIRLSQPLRTMGAYLTEEEDYRLTQLTGELVLAVERLHRFLHDPVEFERKEEETERRFPGVKNIERYTGASVGQENEVGG